MYMCENCGAAFEDPHITPGSTADCAGEIVSLPGDTECPHCGWGGYDELEQCEGCDEWYEPGQLEDGLCERCYMQRQIRKVAGQLQAHPALQELLDDVHDRLGEVKASTIKVMVR